MSFARLSLRMRALLSLCAFAACYGLYALRNPPPSANWNSGLSNLADSHLPMDVPSPPMLLQPGQVGLGADATQAADLVTSFVRDPAKAPIPDQVSDQAPIPDARRQIINEHLADSSVSKRALGVSSLTTLAPKDGLPRVLPYLQDPNPEIRIAAVCAAASLGGDINLFTSALADRVPEVRLSAYMAMGDRSEPKALVILFLALERESTREATEVIEWSVNRFLFGRTDLSGVDRKMSVNAPN